MEHRHSWIVFNVVDEGWLLVRCECGKVGAVKNLSLEEWSLAYNSPRNPYAWTEDDRVELLIGWTAVLDQKHQVWTVVRE